MVKALVEKLDKAHGVVDELVRVFREYGADYDREKAYTEDIDAKM